MKMCFPLSPSFLISLFLFLSSPSFSLSVYVWGVCVCVCVFACTPVFLPLVLPFCVFLRASCSLSTPSHWLLTPPFSRSIRILIFCAESSVFSCLCYLQSQDRSERWLRAAQYRVKTMHFQNWLNLRSFEFFSFYMASPVHPLRFWFHRSGERCNVQMDVYFNISPGDPRTASGLEIC